MTTYPIIADEKAIQSHIDAMAARIIADYKNAHPLFVALLRGAAPFASKLMFSIARQAPDFHPEIDYMMVTTYGSERSAHAPEIVTDLAPTTDVKGRSVVLLDDVLDKGITADFVAVHLTSLGASDVKLAVLVDKHTTRIKPIEADYSCLSADDVWLAGMGMDDTQTATEGYRWNESIIDVS